MMTINTQKIFWINIQKILIFTAFLLFFASCKKNETLKTSTFRTNSGWGYTISYKEKTLIKQTVIPVISENKSFATERDALKVADLVKDKLEENLSPTVTEKDLILLKIKL
ncbi:DUF4907 domain-containing protein [Flavobacterium ginsenosidimutans]|uniref:DUF4907 domain-containing protein n=1 Tax=Flavobacterium ginsenosidimutans TaxID=687844 RepID=A0ABZ2Q9X7_9FLAO|nr:DUF4907 domain-containing protein [Flavobacterium ginsenosidimutans]